jgi:hypothetical protein
VACVLAYAKLGYGWGFFALFFLVPDLSLFAFLAGSRTGAAFYNATHSLIGAAAVLAFGSLSGSALAISVGLVWCAHIGFDRMLGYGLKYASGFGFTHLGLIGRARLAPNNSFKPKPLRGSA